jgi:hypothetical protein
MQSADAVCRTAAAKREISHIKLFMLIVGMFASKRHQIADADVYSVGVGAQILRDPIRRETIKAGWHRRVRGKDVTRTSRRERNFERLPSLHHKSARASQHCERRVSFVKMTNFRAIPELVKQSPTTDTEQYLL